MDAAQEIARMGIAIKLRASLIGYEIDSFGRHHVLGTRHAPWPRTTSGPEILGSGETQIEAMRAALARLA